MFSLSKQHLQSTAGANLPEFESGVFCSRSSAGLAQSEHHRSFFGHIFKTVSCILGTEYLCQIAYHSGGI
jgi:hypothetical protein